MRVQAAIFKILFKTISIYYICKVLSVRIISNSTSIINWPLDSNYLLLSNTALILILIYIIFYLLIMKRKESYLWNPIKIRRLLELFYIFFNLVSDAQTSDKILYRVKSGSHFI